MVQVIAAHEFMYTGLVRIKGHIYIYMYIYMYIYIHLSSKWLPAYQCKQTRPVSVEELLYPFVRGLRDQTGLVILEDQLY